MQTYGTACKDKTHLNGLSPGLRSLVMFSKERPFRATNSASLSATFCTSESDGGGAVGGAAEPISGAAPAHGHGQPGRCDRRLRIDSVGTSQGNPQAPGPAAAGQRPGQQPERCFLAASSPSLSLSAANAMGSLGLAAPRPNASLGFAPAFLLTPPSEN
jgi:hypothetical protein